ncbi:dienelactone hydrolase family protein [Geodermatophilus normandii]|uniref:Dienelactone hydrolase n=1 Tax=Geodermatophilus normandii TaxID=1137989 RepID=A0A6P0GDW1_9ACTN|nr:dienelactone hydrolase family protein [Geodermatophilus normandii]NEM04449.1 dienelactone hydrolase [Geodermatophilus normandii]
MAEVVLFHHALGLTPGVPAFADDLRAAGHTVPTPDLFGGRNFDSVEAGVGHAREIGFGEVVERGARAGSDLPEAVVYAGMSLGVLPAQWLAQTRPGARGAVLLHPCIPTEEFGSRPDGVPVQVHGMDADPLVVDEGDLAAARALAGQTGRAEVLLHPGDQHYSADRTPPSYDPDAAALLTRRVLDLLAGS